MCIFPRLRRDTAGQERYQTITKQYYRRAQVIPLCERRHHFYVSNLRSFSNPFFVDSCSGHRLCLRHHERAVLPAHSEVGQWRGWSESISTLIPLSCTFCPSQWPNICTTAYWTVAAHLTPSGLERVTRWICLMFVFSAVCPWQGAKDLDRKQVWRRTHETGDKGPREQGLIEPNFVLLSSFCVEFNSLLYKNN